MFHVVLAAWSSGPRPRPSRHNSPSPILALQLHQPVFILSTHRASGYRLGVCRVLRPVTACVVRRRCPKNRTGPAGGGDLPPAGAGCPSVTGGCWLVRRLAAPERLSDL
eukprot:scaffold33848_cov139-Isochrysis_galbana.AAC.1